MRAHIQEDAQGEVVQVTVSLSRKNLVSLLHMMDEGRTSGALLARHDCVEILVRGQEDEFHYKDREAGVMSWEHIDG